MATPFDLLALPACCRSAFFDGFTYGRAEGLAEGHRRGYAACDDEISTIQREAARIVHALADAPARDVEADERRAERSRQWWRRRRENPQPQVESSDDRRGEGMSA